MLPQTCAMQIGSLHTSLAMTIYWSLISINDDVSQMCACWNVFINPQGNIQPSIISGI